MYINVHKYVKNKILRLSPRRIINDYQSGIIKEIEYYDIKMCTSMYNSVLICHKRQIDKVSGVNQGEKSITDMANSVKLVSKIGTFTSN